VRASDLSLRVHRLDEGELPLDDLSIFIKTSLIFPLVLVDFASMSMVSCLESMEISSPPRTSSLELTFFLPPSSLSEMPF